MLKLEWDFAVYQETQEPRSDETAPRVARSALPLEKALGVIAGEDPRPLLVLRECARCNKTDNALLSPGYDNEKVLFLARWFHCVKLPVDVIESDQPFHALFPSNEAEHLFVATLDGALRLPLESDTSRSELCSAMSKVLSQTYQKDPASLFRELHTMADQLDVLDARIRALEDKKTALKEARGASSKGGDAKKKLEKLDAEIESARKEIADRIEVFQKSAKIDLKSAPKAGGR
ncbi:MAG: hypothetical protein IPJ19_20190 [Planctomycetes bacterium]|nr:hypothetical protein [Planctomycetota bacterium]